MAPKQTAKSTNQHPMSSAGSLLHRCLHELPTTALGSGDDHPISLWKKPGRRKAEEPAQYYEASKQKQFSSQSSDPTPLLSLQRKAAHRCPEGNEQLCPRSAHLEKAHVLPQPCTLGIPSSQDFSWTLINLILDSNPLRVTLSPPHCSWHRKPCILISYHHVPGSKIVIPLCGRLLIYSLKGLAVRVLVHGKWDGKAKYDACSSEPARSPPTPSPLWMCFAWYSFVLVYFCIIVTSLNGVLLHSSPDSLPFPICFF